MPTDYANRIAAEARSIELDGQIANLKLAIAKLQRAEYGASSEKGARLVDQLEMQLGELVETASAAAILTPGHKVRPHLLGDLAVIKLNQVGTGRVYLPRATSIYYCAGIIVT